MDTFAVARYGMMAASQRFGAAATKVADTSGEGFDAGAMVDMTLAKTQFKAQVGVMKIADEMQRALLDLQTVRD